MSKLAVIAPKIGVRSETFISKHMDNLLPGNTLVLAKTNKPPLAGHWNTISQAYLLDHYPPNPWKVIQTIVSQLAGEKSLNSFFFHREYVIKYLLKKHNVSVLMGEYLDYTHAFIEPADALGIPLWGHAHGYDISKLLLDDNWRHRYLDYNHTEGIITVNQISKKRLIELGIRADKVHVVPCGVDVPQTCPRHNSNADGLIRCLAVGRMVRKKAPLLLLESFRNAIKHCPGMHLDYVGTGELMNEVKLYITKFGLDSHVTLHGEQFNEKVRELMMKSDIFIQHSIVDPITGDEEGMPVAILEAMAHGLPIISTRHAGIPDAVIDTHTGFLVSEGDTDSMAGYLVRLAQNYDERSEMGHHAWQQAVKNFSWERERNDLTKIMGL